MEQPPPPPSSSDPVPPAPPTTKSALQDNLERKGKNAYYFAHAHQADGPPWDGKPEPRLLSKQESVVGQHKVSSSTLDYSKSNISKYAFLDDGAKVKLYIDLEPVLGGDKCTPPAPEDVVTLDYSDRSLSLVVHGCQPPQILRLARLTADISTATFRIQKQQRLIVTLTKVDPTLEWHTLQEDTFV